MTFSAVRKVCCTFLLLLLGGIHSHAQAPVHLDHFCYPEGYFNCLAADTVNEVFYVGGAFTHIGPPVRFAARIVTGTAVPITEQDAPNGAVRAVAGDANGNTWLGGDFDLVGNDSAHHAVRLDANGHVVPWDPRFNGSVRELAVSGDTLYAAGPFLEAAGQPRMRLAAFRISTGELLPWAPAMNGEIHSMVVHGNKLIVGGYFSGVNGTSHTNLASLDRTSGLADAGFPQADGFVNALRKQGDTLFVAGTFLHIGGLTRTRLAAIALQNGTITALDVPCNGTVYALAVDGDSLYVGGNFTVLGAQPHQTLGLVRISANAAGAWAPATDGTVVALEATTDTVFVAGQFTAIGGLGRSNLAAMRRGTALAHPWRCDASRTVNDLLLRAGTLTVGGEFRTVGCEVRQGLAGIDANTGQLTPWNPIVDGIVRALLVRGDTLYVGGAFGAINGAARRNLAALRVGPNDIVLPWAPVTELTGFVTCLDEDAGLVYAGGNFNTVNGLGRPNAASVDRNTGVATSWYPDPNQQVNAIDARGPVVYIGGYFWNVDGQTPRAGIAAVQSNTGWALPWNAQLYPGPGPFIPSVHDIIATDEAIYACGGFLAAGADLRHNIVALDPATAQALPWAPEPDYGVEAMELFGSHLIAAGSFITMNGDTCNKVALLDLAGADAQSWDPQLYPQLYGDVQEVVVLGNKMMLAGGFTHAAGTDREGMAVFELPTTLGQGPTSLAEENGLAVPNPFSAQLHLVLPADDHGPWSYALHDPAGRPLRQGRLSADGLITGLEGLAPGSYVVCATSVRSRILAQVVKTDR